MNLLGWFWRVWWLAWREWLKAVLTLSREVGGEVELG